MTVQMPLTIRDEEMRNCCVRTSFAAAPTSSGGVMMPPTYYGDAKAIHTQNQLRTTRRTTKEVSEGEAPSRFDVMQFASMHYI